ncbi:hypothetical protein CPB83DRAFT_863648 [Crepidotus variabilis]|uniref:Serine protease inhibitor n=1 Tax=Crepidotus variabilis TaxID=179855 RepID=A0A9P6E5M1_9AGAR|nr:hypothetical protein CPB83DRAFT_863648 [Crepidotus variabilis]
MAPLPNGRYIIRSVGARKFVGRSPREDYSLLPKRVILLPDGVQAPFFEFQSTDRGTKILAGGNSTAEIDRNLFAVLLPEPPAEDWKIQAIPQSGKNRYIITKSNGYEGWIVGDDSPEAQIAIRPLIIGPSEPPFYPPNEVWEIVPYN